MMMRGGRDDEERKMGGVQYEGRPMSGLKCEREQIEWITGVELRGQEEAEQCQCWENYSAQATVGGLAPSPLLQLLSLAIQVAVVDNWEQDKL